jgi:hypothetical protein
LSPDLVGAVTVQVRAELGPDGAACEQVGGRDQRVVAGADEDHVDLLRDVIDVTDGHGIAVAVRGRRSRPWMALVDALSDP